MKIRVPRRPAFFCPRPILPLPAGDRLIVPLACSKRGPLQRPAHSPQHAPDMAWVVTHPAHPLDHHGNTRQRPQLRGVALGLRALQQRLFDALELRRAKLTWSPQRRRLPESTSAALAPESVPPHRGDPRHAEPTSNLSLRRAFPEQPGSLEPALT